MTDRDVRQEIKDAINIEDVVSSYTKLEHSGSRMKGLSPFTNEKTASFFVDPSEGVWYCFSSGQGGDIFTFIQRVENVEFYEALKILAEKAGISLNETKSSDKYSELYKDLEKITHTYQSYLSDEVRSYLNKRGITDESINSWRIGFATDGWNNVCERNISKESPLVVSGTCIIKEDGEKVFAYDRFRNRIMFPYITDSKKIVGFSGRIFGEEEGAKYINSPETPIFHKSSYVYGLHIAKSAIRRNNFSILTEGVIDTIAFHQVGYNCAVATSGTSVTVQHLQTLNKLSQNILLALDSDAAGIKAMLRILPIAFGLEMSVKILSLPENTDPADMMKNDTEGLKVAVKNAISSMEFMYRYVEKEFGENDEDKLRGIQTVILPIVKSSNSLLQQETLLKELSEKFSVSVEALKESMKGVKPSFVKEEGIQRNSPVIQDITRVSQVSVERLPNLLENISMMQVYATINNIKILNDIREKIDHIKMFENIPESTEKVAKLKFDTELEESDDKEKEFLNGFEDIVNRVYIEVCKMEEG